MSRSFYCYVHIVEIYRNFAICVANIYLSLSFILNLIHSTCIWRMNLKFYKVRLINTAAAMSSPGATVVKNLLPMQETWERQVLSLGQKDLLGKETAMHSSILAWKVSWTEEPGGLQSMGSQRVGTTEQRSAHTAAAAAASRHWRRTVCSSMWFPRLLCQSANDMCLHWPLFWLKT